MGISSSRWMFPVRAGIKGDSDCQTRRSGAQKLFRRSSIQAPIAVALAVGFLRWACRSLKPPAAKVCGSPGGPTSPRVRLSDGRHLSYREMGVPKEDANYRIIVIHGFDSSKHIDLPVSQELIRELRIYFLFFDRAGYGESDPNPSRTMKSEAFDVQELADRLQIGPRFYIMGISMGGYPAWSCLRYIPQRLLGASMVVPFVHYWWPSFPSRLSRDALRKLPVPDRWTHRVARYAPWLLHWWMTQKWFPSLSIMSENMEVFSLSDHDREILKKWMEDPDPNQIKVRQQGLNESLVQDLISSHRKWEFSPLDVENPFADCQGSVHIWQGLEDGIIPFEINRYISNKLPWIRYHEIPDKGHFLIFDGHVCETILKELLLG